MALFPRPPERTDSYGDEPKVPHPDNGYRGASDIAHAASPASAIPWRPWDTCSFVEQAAHELSVRVAHRQFQVALDPAACRADGCASDRVDRFLLVRFPVHPDAPPLPRGQVVEVRAVLEQQL